jgi:hypothetical protein
MVSFGMPMSSVDAFQYSVSNIPALTYGLVIVATVALGVAISMNDDNDTSTNVEPTSNASTMASNTLNSVSEFAGNVGNSVGNAISSVTGESESKQMLGGRGRKNKTKKHK